MTTTERYRWVLFSQKTLELAQFEEQLQLATPQGEGECRVLAATLLDVTAFEQYSTVAVLEVAIKESAQEDDEVPHWRLRLDEVAQLLHCDYCVLSPDFALKTTKLAVFDMDSTLIPLEVIDELAQEAGVKPQVAEITEAAMRGELDFNQSFEQRLSLLKGMPREAVDAVRSKLQFNAGAETFLNRLIDAGAAVTIASGGFEPFARRLAQKVPLSEVKANQLEFKEQRLTGRAVHPIVNAEVKAESLQMWRKQRGLECAETMAVGDGANDFLMLKTSGFGVAYKAKPYLRHRADCVLNFAEMDALSDILRVVIENVGSNAT